MNEKLNTLFALYSEDPKTVQVEFITTTPDIYVVDSTWVDSIPVQKDTLITFIDTIPYTNEFGQPDTFFVEQDTLITFVDTVVSLQHLVDTVVIERKDAYPLQVVFEAAPLLELKQVEKKYLYPPYIAQPLHTGYFIENGGAGQGDYSLLLEFYDPWQNLIRTETMTGSLASGEGQEIILPESMLDTFVTVKMFLSYQSLSQSWEAPRSNTAEFYLYQQPVRIRGEHEFEIEIDPVVQWEHMKLLSELKVKKVQIGWRSKYILMDEAYRYFEDKLIVQCEIWGQDTTLVIPHMFHTFTYDVYGTENLMDSEWTNYGNPLSVENVEVGKKKVWIAGNTLRWDDGVQKQEETWLLVSNMIGQKLFYAKVQETEGLNLDQYGLNRKNEILIFRFSQPKTGNSFSRKIIKQ